MNPFEPVHAVYASGRLLRKLADQFGNLGLAAAAYNAGPQRVTDWLAKQGGLPAETQHYVRRITGIPAEEWARSDKAQEISLPPYADCPQLRMASADSLVSTKMSPSEGRVYPRLTGKAAARYARAAKYAWYRGSALKYVSLSPSAAHSSPNEFTKSVHAAVGRVRVANSSK